MSTRSSSKRLATSSGHLGLEAPSQFLGQEAFDFSVHGHAIDRFGEAVTFIIRQDVADIMAAIADAITI